MDGDYEGGGLTILDAMQEDSSIHAEEVEEQTEVQAVEHVEEQAHEQAEEPFEERVMEQVVQQVGDPAEEQDEVGPQGMDAEVGDRDAAVAEAASAVLRLHDTANVAEKVPQLMNESALEREGEAVAEDGTQQGLANDDEGSAASGTVHSSAGAEGDGEGDTVEEVEEGDTEGEVDENMMRLSGSEKTESVGSGGGGAAGDDMVEGFADDHGHEEGVGREEDGNDVIEEFGEQEVRTPSWPIGQSIIQLVALAVPCLALPCYTRVEGCFFFPHGGTRATPPLPSISLSPVE